MKLYKYIQLLKMAAFSDNDYESEIETETKVWNRESLCAIFKCDNVGFLKEVLKTMSPKKVYKIVNSDCFSENDGYINIPHESIKCFKYLVKKGLDINFSDPNEEDDVLPPLHYACMYNHRAIIYILRKGGDPYNESYCGEKPFELYFNYGGTNIEIIREAIVKGFSVKSRNHRGESLIHEHMLKYNNDKFLPLLDLLIEYGLNINVKDKNGNSFLHGNTNHSDRPGYTNKRKINNDLIRELHKRGFDFNAKNKQGISVIDSFKDYPNIEEMKELVKNLDYDSQYGDIKEPDD